MENHPSLFESALSLRPTAIAYQAGQRLHELFPGKVIIECSFCGFDLDAFVQAGQAAMTPASGYGYSQIQMSWRGCENDARSGACVTGETGVHHRVLNSFLQIQWQGHRIEAIVLTWGEMMGQQQRICYLIGESKPLLEGFYTAACEWSSVPHGELLVFEQGSWRKDRQLFLSIQKATFQTLVVKPGLKESLSEDVRGFFARRDFYLQYGVPWKRGILLVGPPGNGKTHAVKALCHAAEVPVLYVRSLEPMGVFHGSEHANISLVFDQARKTSPCLLVLEDLDALVKPTNRSLFLNELDGFADNAGVCVVATTNFPERLDPSILDRPSRFDRKYSFDLPAPSERLSYLTFWNCQQKTELQLSDSGLQSVVEATDGFSFAYLKELCLAATMAWINAPSGTSMDSITFEQAQNLRNQMRSTSGESEPPSQPPSRRERVLDALAASRHS